MKNKLTILLFFVCLNVFAQVPNNNHFTFRDVCLSVYGSYSAGMNLTAAFEASSANLFDPTYGSKTMNPKTLLGFRNYGHELGGYIFYILQPGDIGYVSGEVHGLVSMYTNNGSIGIKNWTWPNNYTPVGTTSTAIGTGNQNTIDIIATLGAGSYAAKDCYDLVIDGYNDWYLPSLNELIKLYQYFSSVGRFFACAYNWSSSEISSQYAYAVITSGTAVSWNKLGGSSCVYPIRSF
jgi:hypothetical protein